MTVSDNPSYQTENPYDSKHAKGNNSTGAPYAPQAYDPGYGQPRPATASGGSHRATRARAQGRKRPVAATVTAAFAVWLFIGGLMAAPIGLIIAAFGALLGFQAYRVYNGAHNTWLGSTARAIAIGWWSLVTAAGFIGGIAYGNFSYILVSVLTGAYVVYLIRGGRWLVFFW
ncbi:MAG: hypothetical protein ACM3ML_20215 [Micromonosporaceae bacterium]